MITSLRWDACAGCLCSMLVWGVGRHHFDAKQVSQPQVIRPGVNDAPGLAHHVLKPLCSDSETKALASRKLLFLGTHTRAKASNMRADECPDRIASFHVRMPEQLHRFCGSPFVATIWNATFALLQQEVQTEWHSLTADGVHWGRPLSVLAAHALLHQIELMAEPVLGRSVVQ